MLTFALVLFQVAFIIRVLLRTHRDPASRIAWIAVILALPVVGMVAYLLLGETNIGRDRVEHMKAILAARPDIASTPGFDTAGVPEIPERYLGLFKVGHSISGFEPVGGNQARLMADSNTTITRPPGTSMSSSISGCRTTTAGSSPKRSAAQPPAASPVAPWSTTSARVC
jgi:hypothetical protein